MVTSLVRVEDMLVRMDDMDRRLGGLDLEVGGQESRLQKHGITIQVGVEGMAEVKAVRGVVKPRISVCTTRTCLAA